MTVQSLANATPNFPHAWAANDRVSELLERSAAAHRALMKGDLDTYRAPAHRHADPLILGISLEQAAALALGKAP